MSLETTHSPTVPVGGQVTSFDQCLHIVMVIGKCTDRFRGIFWLGGGVAKGGCEGVAKGEVTFRGGIVMREEDFHEGGASFSSII